MSICTIYAYLTNAPQSTLHNQTRIARVHTHTFNIVCMYMQSKCFRTFARSGLSPVRHQLHYYCCTVATNTAVASTPPVSSGRRDADGCFACCCSMWLLLGCCANIIAHECKTRQFNRSLNSALNTRRLHLFDCIQSGGVLPEHMCLHVSVHLCSIAQSSQPNAPHTHTHTFPQCALWSSARPTL